jgi:predicted porin
MNKKLLTLAVGAALSAAPMIAAQAAVTVYGVAHLSVDVLDNGATTDNSLTTLSSNSSYFGLKAEEDLGDGLKALFGAEFQVALDNAASSGTSTGTTRGLANRNVFVGLGGGFGTLRLGNYDDVMKQVGRSVDLFYNEQLGESRAVTRQNSPGATGAPTALVGWDERLANSVNYETPSFGGAKITVNYGMANSNAQATAQDLTALALGLQYSAGPLYLGLAYKTVEVDAGLTKDSVDAYRLTASFKMLNDALRLVGFYQDVSYPTVYFGVSTTQSTYGLGASYAFGKVTLKGQYYVVDSYSADTTSTTGANLMAVGLDYNFSKTTLVYVTYAAVSNDDNAAFSVIGAGHSNPNDATTGMPNYNTLAGAGNDPSGFSIGMRMAF